MKKVFVYIFMSLTQTTSADENPLILITKFFKLKIKWFQREHVPKRSIN